MIEESTKNWFIDLEAMTLAYFKISRGPKVASKSSVLCGVSRSSCHVINCSYGNTSVET